MKKKNVLLAALLMLLLMCGVSCESEDELTNQVHEETTIGLPSSGTLGIAREDVEIPAGG